MTGDPVISRLNFYQRHAKKSNEPVFWQLREESVAGVTFDNRQAIISNLKPGDDLTLEREPENPFDSNAIAVKTSHGLNIGFLNRDIAKDLAPIFDSPDYTPIREEEAERLIQVCRDRYKKSRTKGKLHEEEVS